MRVYVSGLGDYLELGEEPELEYNSILFRYDDLSMSRTVDMNFPLTAHNGSVLGYPESPTINSRKIDKKYSAVLEADSVQILGTIYIGEITPDGYVATFTYGDLSGADALDADLSDILGNYSSSDGYIKLAAGSVTAATTPVSLNSMVCMDYKVNLESSETETGTGYTSANMRVVRYHSSSECWYAYGDYECWWSEDGKQWEKLEDSVIGAYCWYSMAETEDGLWVIVGRSDSTNMVIATSLTGSSWTLVYQSSSSTEELTTSGKTGLTAVLNDFDAVLCVSNATRTIAMYKDGAVSTVSLPSTVTKIYACLFDTNAAAFYIFVNPIYGSAQRYLIAYEVNEDELTYTAHYNTSASFPTHTSGYDTLRDVVHESVYYYFSDYAESVYCANSGSPSEEVWSVWSEIAAHAMNTDSYYVLVGADGKTWYTTAGSSSNLTEGGGTGDNDLEAVAYHSNMWVAVGLNGAMYYSTDHGINWDACLGVISIVTTGYAPMPCVNLAWLAYRAAAACGFTLELSDSAKAVAPYLFIMLPQCKDMYDVEVSDESRCYLRYNLPECDALEIILLYAAVIGEAPYIDGSSIKTFAYDFTGSTRNVYEISEWASVIHAVTEDGAKSNYIALKEPDSDEDEMPAGSGKVWEFTTDNEALDEGNELITSEISSGANYKGIVQVSNIEIDEDDGDTTIEREGDATLCWYDETVQQMKYVAGGVISSLLSGVGLSIPDGVQALKKIYAEALTYTVTLIIPMYKFIRMTYDSVITIDGVAYCIFEANWSSGTAEMQLVRLPESLIR